MKNLIFTIILFAFVVFSFAQERIKGRIIDSENGLALANTIIKNAHNNSFSYSNSVGVFEVESTGVYIISKSGYKEKQITISNSEYQIIQLNINISELNEVIINANQLPKRLKKATNTVNIVLSDDIERANNTNIAPTLNRIPGILMQTGTLSTNRITIRGVGARNLFGTGKIRAYFKDIPLTNGSGETSVEDLELATIARLEIDKGASTIYGAGLGGTIHLTPQNAYLNQTNAQGEFSFGSFGLFKEVINLNHGSSKNSFRATYSNTHSNGYRENNEYDRQTFTLNSNHFLNEKDEITFLFNYVDIFAFIPSSLNLNDYNNNPSAAAPTWKLSKGYEDSKRGIIGLSWNHKFSNHLKQSTSIFTSFRNGYEPRPFDILDEKTFALGIRSRLLGTLNLFDKNLDWTTGVEIFRDNYNYGTYQNLYQNFPDGTGSVQGDQLTDFKEKRSYYNIFLETNYNLSEKTTLSLGLNFNQTSYNLNDRFPASTENPDQTGSYKFDGILSPKLGISHLFSNDFSVYTNISHGFSPITLQETLLPNGQINQDLKPETGWNLEVGTRGSIIKNKLLFNFAAYRLDIKNLLVARITGQDQFVGVNAGRTFQDGLEASFNYKMIDKESFSLNPFISYTLNHYKFDDFIDGSNDYSGNNLTGVPKNVFNAGIDFNSKIGFYGNINFQYVGSMPIFDSNTLYSDSYKLTNLRVGYKITILKALTANLYYGIDNALDEKYASQLLINYTNPRYYYPGNPLNYYTGIHLNYMF